MEEYYKITVTVERIKHPEGVPLHNNRTQTEVANFSLKANDLSQLIERTVKHVELIDE